MQVCGSYPEQVIVPKRIEDAALVASAKFREGGRFPVLAYFHRDTRSAVVRCGQPLVRAPSRRLPFLLPEACRSKKGRS